MLSQPLRLLLIDDSPDDRDLVLRELAKGFAACQAEAITDAESLEQALRTGGFDLVITDYRLHWSDGLSVLRRVKAAYPQCPVIMFTATGTEEIAVEGMKSGLDDYIIKDLKHYFRLALTVRSALERLASQQRTAQLEQHLQALLNRLDVGVFRASVEGQLLEANAAFLHLIGLDSLAAAQAASPLPLDLGLEAPLQDLTWEREVPLRRPDGDQIWLTLSKALSHQDGQAVVEGLVKDITERKQAEQERQRLLALEQTARAEAEAAQQRAAFLAQASQLLAASLDYEITLRRVTHLLVSSLADWCIVDVVQEEQSMHLVALAQANAAQEQRLRELGQPASVAQPESSDAWTVLRTGQSRLVSDLADVSQTTPALNREYLEQLHQLGARSYMIVPLIIRGQKLGVLQLVAAESQRRYTPADLSLAEELAHRAALAIDNARLHQECQTANRLKDEFLTTLSHELRSPLNAILGWAQLLRGGLDAATAARAIETIERNALAQTRLVSDLLDGSRIITGKLRLKTRRVPLVAVVEAALEAVRVAAAAKNLQLESQLDASLTLTLGDPDRLQQVIWNLLSNAIKFTPAGGRIRVRLERVESQAQIAVSDTGSGISAEFLPYVFDRFRQADASITKSHGGLGLGLAIARHLVELHGGTVQAQSRGAGQGATFIVQLPLAPRHGRTQTWQPEFATAPATQPEDTEPSLAGLRVLIVDDEADARELLCVILEQQEAEVISASSTREALSLLQHWRPEVLVSDIGMPGEDGYALIRQVRSLAAEQGGTIPAIALSAYAREEDRRQALEAGFQQHLTKPVEPAQLVRMVAALAAQSG